MEILQDENAYQELFDLQQGHFQAVVRHSKAGERIKKLTKLYRWMVANTEKIYEAVHNDFQKPHLESHTSELMPLFTEIRRVKRNLRDWMRPKRVSAPLYLFGTSTRIYYEPKGVSLILAPWNYPFMLTIGPLISAIAAGNCVIIKPSEITPYTSDLIKEMLEELFPREEIAVALGDHMVASELTRLPFNHIFFTGSPEVGKLVMKAAAHNLSSVTLELGGMNPVVVDETASLRDAASKLIWGKFLNVGQSCMSPNYVFVHEKVMPKLKEELKRAMAIQYDAEPGAMEKNKDFGRMVSRKHFHRVRNLIQESLDMGADVLVGGHTNEEQNYISPTILENVPDDAPVFKQEIFGPVMPLREYKDFGEVIRYINSNQIPLGAYLFTRSEKNIRRFLSETQAGTTCINDTTIPFSHPEIPFGGANFSGIGKAHGHYGFMAFTNERPVIRQRRGMTSVKMVYPHNGKLAWFMAKFTGKYL